MEFKPLLLAAALGLTGLPLASMAESAVGTTAKAVKADTQRIVSDTTLTTKVKTALIRERDLSAMDINVETRNGVVQLSGFVDTLDQQERAFKVAQAVEGVKEVKNDVHLSTAAAANAGASTGTVLKNETKRVIADSTITSKVKAALVREKDLSAMDVNVETKAGVVQLSGFVDGKDQQDRAGRIAQSIEGVKEVKNDLRLKSGS
ncbi:MAG TPA: BON domain-containing protein [Solimonas sp.]|nr:BON domain-containing protein [Solimonas sp.]